MSIDFQAIARSAKRDVEPPWDELRAARTQKKIIEALNSDDPENELGLESDDAPSDVLKTRASREPRKRAYAIALIALAAAAAWFLWLRAPEAIPAATWATAELNYKDGSRSVLGNKARVQVVEESASRVKVQQQSGKVRYEVVPNPGRRFSVRTRGVAITVLGTVFDVQVEPHLVTISVERGKVQVDHDGEQVVLTPGKRLAVSISAETKKTTKDEASSDPQSKSEPTKAEETEPSPQAAPRASVSSTPTQADSPPVTPTGAGGDRAARPTADDLMGRADRARGSGDHTTASTALTQLLSEYPNDRRATLARFNLAQVRRAQGQHVAAARLFEQCGRALRGDAMAEAAGSWQQAGRSGHAQAAAKRYLDAFPGGVHAESMRKLSGGK